MKQQLTLKAIAERVGVSDRIVSAWEKGEHAPKIDVMPELLAMLKGAWSDVSRLLSDDATEELAKELAKDRLEGAGLTEEQRMFLEHLGPDQREALLNFAQQMLASRR